MLRLELVDVTKRYPGVTANDHVCLAVRPGEIHAVLGENGAGKSTLMQIVYGVVQPDAGVIRLDGEALLAHDPRAARARGVAMVFQHFSLFESMTVAENVWLARDRRLSLASVAAELRRAGDAYGLPLDPQRVVHDLSAGERQRVELLRALLGRPRLLILDEPTSVLTPQAAGALFATLRQLASEGCSVLYVSHKLDEIQSLCHTATVLRAGRVACQVDPRRETTASLARAMLGRDPPRLERPPARPGEVRLQVDGLNVDVDRELGTPLRQIAFSLHAGEILGIAGVSGNGQRELLAALSGEGSAPASGCIRLGGADVTRVGPTLRRARGLRFIPEERLGRATVGSLPLWKNVLLTRRELAPCGIIRPGRLRALTLGLLARYEVTARNPDSPAGSLSGGNLQKFVVARELDAKPGVLVVAQPTWGVDVAAAALLRQRLVALRDAGAALLVVSEDLDELLTLCDALVVMARGRLSPRLSPEQMSSERIGAWMSGLWLEPATAALGAPLA
ncbi:MAG TPA: ABC transporter ATP-binding protein [Polyangiaceae bacterium]|nr:ABC transporter ATP-binding protein [Polyangiaceae bacterium]